MKPWVVTICWCLFVGIVQNSVEQFAIADDNSLFHRDAALSTLETKPEEPAPQPLTQLGNDFHNSIELLQNRFRIDYKIDEVTMIFFREYGSSPIVLVKPDGSKVFQNDADEKTIFWYDSTTYDMISLKNPDIGPWQAVGDILPNSRVMVISDLALHVNSLPKIIFSGEIIKQTAYLTNDGKPIDYEAFRDVVELTISLASTNNPNYNNFGSNSEIIATFQDNGKGMDETPLDGVFTGQFNLAIADGEWIPTFKVATPMYSREQVDPAIMLLPNPISIDVDIDDGTGGYHILKVDADRQYVDMSSLLLDGKVRFPNGDIQNFSITDISEEIRRHELINFSFGVYRVKLTAFGNTLDGREFILDVPEFSFLVEEPRLVEPVTAPPVEQTPIEDNELDIAQTPPEQGLSDDELITIVITVNVLLLVIGGLIIWFIVSDTKLNLLFWKKQQTEIVDLSETEKTADSKGLLAKLGFIKKLFKRENKAEQAVNSPVESQEKDKDGGFIDLSAPKE